jgi:type IV secretion system protein TrbE
MSLFQRSAALPDVLPYGSFIADGVCEMRGLGIMVGCQMIGLSPEADPPDDVVAARDQLSRAMVHLTAGDMIQFVQHRDPAPVPKVNESPYHAVNLFHQELLEQFEAQNYWLTPCELYLTHQYETVAKGWAQALLVARQADKQQIREEVLADYALQRFDAYQNSANTGVKLRRMNSEEMFRSLLRCVTYHDYPALLPDSRAPLNEIIGAERLGGGYVPFINGFYLRPIVITLYPTETLPQTLATLQMDSGRLTISARFICTDHHEFEKALDQKRKAWNRTDFRGWWATIKSCIAQKKIEPTQDVVEQLTELDEIAAEASRGQTYGWCTATIIVRDEDPNRAEMRVRAILNACHAMGIMARAEDFHALEAVQGSWPGNGWSNKRRPMVTADNFADLILPRSPYLGGRSC